MSDLNKRIDKDVDIIGIDLGTTNSCVAIVENGQPPRVITNENGDKTIPSIVSWDGKQLLVGNEAKESIFNDSEAIFSVKRFMGTKEEITLGGKKYSPEQISAMILQYIKTRVEVSLKRPISKAIVTVPAYFDDSQRQATINAGKIAGLDIVRIVNEPTSASLAYGLDKLSDDMKILVYDLGGGTFDVSLLHLHDGIFDVMATSGDNHLGGDDWDRRLEEWIISSAKALYNKDIDMNNHIIANKVKGYAEWTKVQLSFNEEVTVDISDLVGNEGASIVISKIEFEELTKDLMDRTKFPVEDAVKESGLDPSQIDKIIMVGGSTKMPMIREYVKSYFGRDPEEGVNPDEVVAIGAAVLGSSLKGEINVQLNDVIPITIGMASYDGTMTPIIKRNTKIPCKKTDIFTTSFDNQDKIEVKVTQGERTMSEDNKILGEFEFIGLDPAPAEEPQIEITYAIDENGILNVSAKDLKTGKFKEVTIKDTSGLSSDEIRKMIADAEKFKNDDLQKMKNVELSKIAWEYIELLVKYVNENPYDKLPYYKRDRSIAWIRKMEGFLEKEDYRALRVNFIAFQFHMYVTMYEEIKKGYKMNFKTDFE